MCKIKKCKIFQYLHQLPRRKEKIYKCVSLDEFWDIYIKIVSQINEIMKY